MTQKETADLDQAGLLVAKAVGQVSVGSSALKAYAGAAPGLISQLRQNFDASLKLYQQGKETVNFTINEAKEIAEVQDKVLMSIIDAATEGLASKITIVERELPGIESYSLGEFKEQFMGDELMKPLAGKLNEAIEAAKAPPSPAAAPALAGADELAFEKAINSFEAKAMQFLPIANLATDVSQPLGGLDEAVKNARELGKTRHDLPVSRILSDAQRLVDLGARLAASAPAITKATSDLQSAVTLAKAIAPVDATEAEKQIWISWVASLDKSNFQSLDMDVIENHLKRLGIWDQLGINPGMWFSADEQGMAVYSAAAQEKITSHRGSTVIVALYNGRPDRVSLPDITPQLPVKMASDSQGVDFQRDIVRVEAVVVGAMALKKADTGVFDKTGPSRDARVDYLLSNGYDAVILKGMREVPAGTAGSD